MADEVDLPGKKDYRRELVYKHSWRGERDRKINRIKRLGRKRYMKWGLALGIVVGVIVTLALAAFLGGF